MIKIEKLSKRFGKTSALNEVSLHLPPGHCVGLIGPNACGKTTLIKCILGMVIPSEGKIIFKGRWVQENVLYKKDIGYMPQIGRYPENIQINHVFDMIRSLRKFDGEEDWTLWNEFGLSKIKDKKMGTLSGGTIQKVSAALAFLHQPQVLILDEPTAGLDPVSSEILREKILTERKKGKLIMITSHVLSELDELLTDIVFMQESKIVFNKPIEELYKSTGEIKISKAITKLLKQDLA